MPAAVEAPQAPGECTYEGVSRENGAWGADIKLDGEIEIKRLGTYENAGAAAWAYDAAREERGLPPVNFPLPGMAPAPTNEAPAPAESPREAARLGDAAFANASLDAVTRRLGSLRARRMREADAADEA